MFNWLSMSLFKEIDKLKSKELWNNYLTINTEKN